MSEAAATGQAAVVDCGRRERQVDRVEVTVKLKCTSRPAALEPDHDSRRFGIAARWTLDDEAVVAENLRRGGR